MVVGRILIAPSSSTGCRYLVEIVPAVTRSIGEWLRSSIALEENRSSNIVLVVARKTLVVYGDFNCPFSALASARVDRLTRRGLALVEWRAVEHAPSINDDGEEVDATRAADVNRELDDVRALLTVDEGDVLRSPRRVANTRAANAAYAATPLTQRAAVRGRLFAGYWADGLDLNDPTVLNGLTGHLRDETTAARWQKQYVSLPRPIVPTLVLVDGTLSRGLGALARLADILSTPAAIASK